MAIARKTSLVVAMLALLGLVPVCRAQSVSPDQVAAERKAAFDAANQAMKPGPREIKLADQATLKLPQGFGYVPPAEGERVLRAMGNTVRAGFQGMIVPGSQNGFYALGYEATGHIDDDDAKSWKADDLLEQLRKGTGEDNKRRKEMGVPELEIVGWVEPPQYEASKHQLIWSIRARDAGAPSSQGEGVNYRTLVLGREGFMSMTLVTDQAQIESLKPATALLLDNLVFNEGKQYADFNAKTDHVAEFGLAALIAGVAVKKLGLLALITAFVLKFAKVIAVAVVAVLLAMRKKLGWTRKVAPATAGAADAQLAPSPPAASAAGPPADHASNPLAERTSNTPGQRADT